jgi:hypothetical protein
MTEPTYLPPFIRDAMDGASDRPKPAGSQNAADVERTLLALEDKLCCFVPAEAIGIEPEELKLAQGWSRIEACIGALPYRYGPFFAKLAELLDWSEQTVVSELARLREPGVWKLAGLPGISKVVMKGGPRVQSAEVLFVRFKPGVRFPRHQHTGVERALVLEGSYSDDGGMVHGPGELREWAVGTEHAFEVHSGGPCILASVVYGRRFSAWPLRVLASVLDRRR